VILLRLSWVPFVIVHSSGCFNSLLHVPASFSKLFIRIIDPDAVWEWRDCKTVIPSGSRELVIPLQQRRVVVFEARQSGVEQSAVRVILRLAIRFCAEIGEAGDVIPLRQREFGEGAADGQGQIKEYGSE